MRSCEIIINFNTMQEQIEEKEPMQQMVVEEPEPADIDQSINEEKVKAYEKKYAKQTENRRVIKEENKKVMQEIKQEQIEQKKLEKDDERRKELEQLREETRQKKIQKMRLINEKRNKAITKQLKPVFQTLRGVQKMKERFRRQYQNKDIVDFLKQNVDILFENSGMEDSDLKNLLRE